MAYKGPPSSREGSIPSSRTATIGGRVQRDVRLQAALALVVGVALVAVPLFIWGRGKKPSPNAGASASLSNASDDAGPPTVIFGDAGTVAIDAGGRSVTFGQPLYLKCQDPGPGKTPPEKCDHLAVIEEQITKQLAEKASSCMPPSATAVVVNTLVEVRFNKKKLIVKAGKDGATMGQKERTKAVSCMMKGMPSPVWDGIGHAHQRYLFQLLTTFGPSATPGVPGAPPPGGGAPVAPGPTIPP